MTALAIGALAPGQPQPRGATPTPDDSVVAREALPRVRELAAGGNTALALGVLQDLLDREGDRLLPSADDPSLFYPVRRLLHELLLSEPALLDKYRVAEGPRAQQLLDAGDHATVERTRLLTAPGFEAALRVAQLELEAGRFESARLVLQQLERHPDRSRGGRGAADAAGLATLVASYIGRDDALAWAARWTRDAGLSDLPRPPALPVPAHLRPGESALAGFAATPDSGGPREPLQAVALGDQRGSRPSDDPAASRLDASRWILPTVAGDTVMVNDGVRVAAFDQATLAPVWEFSPVPSGSTVADLAAQANSFRPNELEDVSAVTVWGGVAVAATGVPAAGGRAGDSRVHALQAADGRALWSAELGAIDPRLVTAAVRGPVVVEEGTAVIAARRQGMARRETQLFLAGVDLYSGRTRWVRSVASVGTLPWGRLTARAEGASAWRGVVYRGDDMGVLGAYEAATGRPVWVRVMRSRSVLDPIYRGAGEITPRELVTPVVVEGQVLYLEPGLPRVSRFDPADGRVLGARETPSLGNPAYLVPVGAFVACVSGERVALVRADDFDKGPVRLVPLARRTETQESLITGRVVRAGPFLVVPSGDQIVVADPAAPDSPTVVELLGAGNLAFGSGGAGPTALSVSGDSLGTYISWSRARDLLTARAEASPRDTRPLRTYLDLACRSGNADLAPGLADRILSLADADPLSSESARARQHLFELLAVQVTESREAWNRPDAPRRPFSPPPVRDARLLESLVERMGRAAEGPEQQAGHLLERAWLADVTGAPSRAVEAYQRLIADSSFDTVTLSGLRRACGLPADRARDGPVSREASDRLLTLLGRVGPAAYRAFDEEAAGALAALPPDAGAERTMALARRYPAAQVAPELWRRAGDALAAAARPDDARRAYGSGLIAAESSVAIGRSDQSAQVGRLAGSLASMSDRPGMREPVYRMLRRLAMQYPDLSIPSASGSATPARLAESLRRALADRPALPDLGPSLGPGVQALETWTPLEPLMAPIPGGSRDTMFFISDVFKRAALFGVAAEDGRLNQLWTRPFDAPPHVLRIMPDEVILYWTTATGGRVEAVDTVSGATRWQTPDAAELFERAGARQNDDAPMLFTPLDGRVRATDIILTADASTLVLAQRNGRAAAFDLATGQRLWVGVLDVDIVYEIELCAGRLVVAGATGLAAGKPAPAAVSLDTRTGRRIASLPVELLGDHPRWIRATPSGDAILATSDSLIRFSPATGEVAWTVQGGPAVRTTAGWIAGDDLYVLDPDDALWRYDANAAITPDKPMDTRGRITLPARGVVSGDTLALSFQLGLLIYRDGALVGSDTPRTFTRSLPAVPSQRFFFAADTADEPPDPGEFALARVLALSAQSGQVMATQRVKLPGPPQQIVLMDGRVLLVTGEATIVFDAAP